MVQMWTECLSSSDMPRRGETGHLEEVEEVGGGEVAEVVEGEREDLEEVLEEVLEAVEEEEAGEGVSAPAIQFLQFTTFRKSSFLTAQIFLLSRLSHHRRPISREGQDFRSHSGI